MDFDLTKQKINDFIENADSQVSTANGTIVSLIVGGCAAVIAGVYGYAESIKRAIFPDTCSPDDLMRHAAIKGVEVLPDSSTDVIRRDVLTAFRVPPSSADFWSWKNMLNGIVKNMPGVNFAMFENEDARGMGSADIVLSWQASQENLNVLKQIAGEFRPWGLADLQCGIAERFDVEIQILSQGTCVNNNAVKQEILNQYGQNSSREPGAPIYQSRIESIAVNYGANNAKMRWREAGSTEWIDGDAGKKKIFEDVRSKYFQAVVTDCFTE